MLHRSLIVLCLMGCAVKSSDGSPPGVEEWLATWVEARTCLVAAAEDIETGVAVSILEGRECGESLRKLELAIQVNDDGLLQFWRRAVARLRRLGDPSAARRSVEILQIDAAARLLAALHDRDLPSMQRAPSLPRAWARRRETPSWIARLAPAYATSEAGPIKVEVTPAEGSQRGIAYEMSISQDSGVSRARFDYEGHLVTGRDHLRAGVIELIVERAGRLEKHRLVPDGKPAVVQILDAPARAEHLCTHNDVSWSFFDGTLHRSDANGVHDLGRAPAGPIRCGAKSAAVIDSPDQVYRCRDHTCRRELRSPAPKLDGHASILDDGRWIFAIDVDGVAAIWIEGTASPFYVRTVGNVEWSAVFRGLDVLEIDGVRLPLTSSRVLGL